jgi:hypothetical protein
MRTIPIASITALLQQPMWDSDNMIYRGVRSSSYELLTSVGRFKAATPEGHRKFEEQLYAEFKRRAQPYLQSTLRSNLEWLYLAQHYGTPTRLLDWTTSPLIALFFAASGNGIEDFAVYKALHSKWLEPNSDSDPFEVDQVLGIRPPHSDVRFVNQEGVFTIHPDPTLPYDDEHMIKFVFPATKREEIQWNLKKLGISNSRIYPGLEGVARDVVEASKYHLNRSSIRGSAVGP